MARGTRNVGIPVWFLALSTPHRPHPLWCSYPRLVALFSFLGHTINDSQCRCNGLLSDPSERAEEVEVAHIMFFN